MGPCVTPTRTVMMMTMSETGHDDDIEDSHDDDDRVMVGMSQEGVDPDDDRSMMTTRTMITVVVIVMRAEVENGMMSLARRRGSVCDTDPDGHDDDDGHERS